MPKLCVQGRERWAEHAQAWGQTRFGESHRPAWGAGISLHRCGNPWTSSQQGLPWSDGLFSAVFLADIWNVMWWWRVGLWRQADLCSDPKSTFSEHLHHRPVAVSKPVSILLLRLGEDSMRSGTQSSSAQCSAQGKLTGNGSVIITAGMFTRLNSQNLLIAEWLYFTCPSPQ